MKLNIRFFKRHWVIEIMEVIPFDPLKVDKNPKFPLGTKYKYGGHTYTYVRAGKDINIGTP